MSAPTIELHFLTGLGEWSFPLTDQESCELREHISKSSPSTESVLLDTIRNWLPSETLLRALKAYETYAVNSNYSTRGSLRHGPMRATLRGMLETWNTTSVFVPTATGTAYEPRVSEVVLPHSRVQELLSSRSSHRLWLEQRQRYWLR